MRSKNALLNLIAALLLSAVTAVSGLILPKLYILTYGSEVNGLIASIKQFIVYLSLVEAGIGYASMAVLYKPIRHNAYKEINSILSSTKNQYIKSGWFFLALIAILSVLYPFIVADQIPWNLSFLMVLVLGINGVAEFFLISKYSVFLTAAQKGYVISYIQTGALILNLFTLVILMSLNINPVIVQLAASVIYLLRFILVKNYLYKHYPVIDYNVPPNDQALSKRWDVLIHQIVNLILVNTPIIIITIFIGLKDVSIFMVYLLVHNMVVLLLSVFMNGFQAIFGDMIAEKNKVILSHNYRIYERLFFLIVTIVYVLVGILYMPFVELYTTGISDANYIRPGIALMFIFIGILHNLRIPSMTIINGAGLYRETKLTAIIEAIISLLLSILLVQKLGIEGVLLGWLIAYSYRIIYLIKQVSKDFIYGSIWPTLYGIFINVIVGFFAYYICRNYLYFNVNSYGDFLINGLICGLLTVFITLSFNFFFFKEDFKLIVVKVKSLTIRKETI